MPLWCFQDIQFFSLEIMKYISIHVIIHFRSGRYILDRNQIHIKKKVISHISCQSSIFTTIFSPWPFLCYTEREHYFRNLAVLQTLAHSLCGNIYVCLVITVATNRKNMT